MVTPTPPPDSEFSWSCSGCPIEMESFQLVADHKLQISDSGELNCSVTVGYEKYTSESIELRVIGEYCNSAIIYDK